MPQRDQVAELLGDRGYHLAYAPATRFWREGSVFSHGEFGNAIASRFPILESEAIALPDAGDGEKRCALSATLAAPARPALVHLHAPALEVPPRRGARAAGAGGLRSRAAAPAARGLSVDPGGRFQRRARVGRDPLRLGPAVARRPQRRVPRRLAHGGHGRRHHVVEPESLRARQPRARPPHRLHLHRLPDAKWHGAAARRAAWSATTSKNGIWPSDHFGVYAELRSEPLAPHA